MRVIRKTSGLLKISRSFNWNAKRCGLQTLPIHHVADSHLWIPVIGLEVHAQISSKSKLFSGSSNTFMAPPNSVVSNFDASMPGTLPVINRACVEKAVTTALALNCRLNRRSYFDRKHYFYADMPLGYQITQQRQPIAVEGFLNFFTLDGSETKQANIKQIQLEQDSGKSLHDENFSFIDLNRAGVGLMEIITGPDFHSANDSLAFIQELYLLLKRLGTCEGKLAEGQFRVDVNISLNKPGNELGTRAEVKNIYGFKTIHHVIEYEIQRQSEILSEGGTVEQETRAFDDKQGITVPMRDKEVKQDYRFMPEPNLPPLQLYDDQTVTSAANLTQAVNVDDLRRRLPITPAEMRKKLVDVYGLSFDESMLIVAREMDKFFIDVINCAPQLASKKVYDWCRIHIIGYLNENNLEAFENFPVTSGDMAELLALEDNLEINHSTALEAFQEAIKQQKSPSTIINENNWKMISDVDVITDICKSAIESLEEAGTFARYEPGLAKKNKKIIKRVTDLVRERTNNQVQTKVTKSVIVKLLDERSKSFD